MENEKKLKYNPEDMIAAADAQFLAWMKEGRYAELIGTMPDLGKYSLRNQMLILMQNPKATFVNGMNAWNYKRRRQRREYYRKNAGYRNGLRSQFCIRRNPDGRRTAQRDFQRQYGARTL